MPHRFIFLFAIFFSAVLAGPIRGDEWNRLAQAALQRAGDNRQQLELAIARSPDDQRAAMKFLIAFMPDRDLTSLTADFLLENHRLAHEAWEQSPWKEKISRDMFLNYILPYANINEGRDEWRADFRKRFLPLVADAETPEAAAVILNRKIFPLLKVKYSTKRKRADQCPTESIKSGLASCTGLSILLIDACRAVGVPARFAGTPLWSDRSGNHSWVEVWDDQWKHTGAAEPQDKLNKVWFSGRAAKAQADHPLHAIYAVRYQRTPLKFPLVWDRSIDYVFAVNVTDRYTRQPKSPPKGQVEWMCRCVDGQGDRLSASITVREPEEAGRAGRVIFSGVTRDERFDRNNHLTFFVPSRQTFIVTGEAKLPGGERRALRPQTVQAGAEARLLTLQIANDLRDKEVIAALKAALDPPEDFSLEKVAALPVRDKPLTERQAEEIRGLLWEAQKAKLRRTRAAEMKAKVITAGELKMPFYYKVFGEKPKTKPAANGGDSRIAPRTGRSLYISMHGGGGAPARVNDQQWQNQKRLYQVKEGVYVAPRAPTNTWNLWHQRHIDGMFQRLIENMIVFEDVDPNRVYLMGYSAGGDGVFQLAPRMADSLAAAAMMAGHPNETSPLGLRNLPFTLHMGGRDGAYNRNKVAADWEQKLAELHKADPDGYVHWVKIYPDKGHWMDREDAAALPWMAQHRRSITPDRIVWKQDDVTHRRFYWLAVKGDQVKARSELRAEISGQTIQLECRNGDLQQAIVRLDDRLLDLDQPLKIQTGDQVRFHGKAPRTLGVIARTLAERNDPHAAFTAELTVTWD